jgi:hypothetical protein
MTTITLPPLPERETDGLRHWYTADQLRARDLEVARVVLDAAISRARIYGGINTSEALRALEVKHHE